MKQVDLTRVRIHGFHFNFLGSTEYEKVWETWRFYVGEMAKNITVFCNFDNNEHFYIYRYFHFRQYEFKSF